MQIHELDNFIGTLDQDTYFAVDDGTETCKVPASNILPAEMTEAEITTGTDESPRVISPAVASTLKVLVVEKASFNSLPQTIADERITTDMVCIKSELGTPSAQTSDWTVDTNTEGQVTISGTISGSTTLKLYLAKSH